ncbi:MAG: HAD-IA family hydrolase [Candidatus Aphodousia sp.]|nr:HAD-IA family hydrolase [Sutterella sp.]MDY2899290.1 HAD-IA family hydrolase [Candidatus Aphodousia sp.]
MLVPKYDLFVFDWDGTVMDTTEPIAAGICHAFTALGYKDPGMKVARSVIGLDWRSAILTIEPKFRFDHYDQFEAAYREYYLVKEKEIGIFPGLENLLRKMKAAGLRLAVATGKSRKGLNRVFAQTGVGELFEASVTADESAGKPNPLMLEMLSQECNVPLSQMVMIGDTEHDLWLAKNAGCAAVAVSYGAFPKSELVKWKVPVVDDVPQLAAAIGVDELL